MAELRQWKHLQRPTLRLPVGLPQQCPLYLETREPLDSSPLEMHKTLASILPAHRQTLKPCLSKVRLKVWQAL